MKTEDMGPGSTYIALPPHLGAVVAYLACVGVALAIGCAWTAVLLESRTARSAYPFLCFCGVALCVIGTAAGLVLTVATLAFASGWGLR